MSKWYLLFGVVVCICRQHLSPQEIYIYYISVLNWAKISAFYKPQKPKGSRFSYQDPIWIFEIASPTDKWQRQIPTGNATYVGSLDILHRTDNN
eukprot:SAG22_NODE_74_length_22289_cov_65.265119_5_plen_94_part_00